MTNKQQTWGLRSLPLNFQTVSLCKSFSLKEVFTNRYRSAKSVKFYKLSELPLNVLPITFRTMITDGEKIKDWKLQNINSI